MCKRLYFPAAPDKYTDTPKGKKTWVCDAKAQLCLYLWQAGLVDFDEDAAVQKFLSSYVKSFQKAKGLDVGDAIANDALLTLHNNYQIPEDYRAFRTYVSRTINGLAKRQRRLESLAPIPTAPDGNTPQTIPELAAQTGRSEWALYRDVRYGRVRTTTQPAGARHDMIAVPPEEAARIKNEVTQKRIRQELIAMCTERRGIAQKSARKWVERHECAGLALCDIYSKLRGTPQRMSQQCADDDA